MPYENYTLNHSALSLECFDLDINLNSTEYLFIAHILTSIINSISSFTAVTGNVAVILAVWKTPVLQTPSNVFLCCLAFSDFTVGLIAQPCFVLHKIGEMLHGFGSMYCTTRILLESLGFVTAGASVATMAGIAIERYLALYLHLRYKEIVTTKRIITAASFIWIFCIFLAASRFWIANDSIFNNIAIAVLFVSLVFSFVAYAKVFKYVRWHERQIKDQNINADHPADPRNRRVLKIKCYKKSTMTMVYIVGMFIVCYLPFICVKIVCKFVGYTTPVKTAYLYASTVVFLNSSFNPVVYCWRITDIRRAVQEVCSHCFGANSRVVTVKASVGFQQRARVSSINITRASVSISAKLK